MAWTSADIPDLTGRVAVVTGANGGLGLETAAALAGAGAHTVLAARSPEKTADAEAEIRRRHPDASLAVVPLDLASQSATDGAATAIVAAHPTIDILVNNAGLMAMPERSTDDGFEMQLGVNHLGHWTFTAGLLPSLLAAPSARIVTVTSFARHSGRPIDPANPHLHGTYNDWRAYGQAKLANFHFALGLDRRLRDARARASSLAAHPGLAHTDLQQRTVREGGGGTQGPFWAEQAEKRGMPAARAALPQLRAATDPRAHGGQLYGPRWVTRGNPTRLPVWSRPFIAGAIETLWEVSERETGVPLDVHRATRP